MKIEKRGVHIDHMLRQTRSHHVQLSFMADSKASMLMTMASVIFTLSASFITKPQFKWATISLMIFCLITIFLAVYAAMPKLPFFIKQKSFKDLNSPRFNLLFFGDFIRMSFKEYEESMEDVLNDPDMTYQVQLKELYNLGIFLANKKYRFLKMAYIAFIIGLLVSGSMLFFQLIL